MRFESLEYYADFCSMGKFLLSETLQTKLFHIILAGLSSSYSEDAAESDGEMLGRSVPRNAKGQMTGPSRPPRKGSLSRPEDGLLNGNMDSGR